MLIQKMFEPILSRIPRNRYDLVNYLDIPDVSLEPYIWVPPEDYLYPLEPTDSDYWSGSVEEAKMRARSFITESDLALSRALTDSEIDYERYKRIKYRRLSDPFAQMREAINYFPSSYLDSLHSYPYLADPTLDNFEELRLYNERLRRFNEERRLRNAEWRLKMARDFDGCSVFAPDDPGARLLEDAIRNLNFRKIELELTRLGI